MTLRIPYELCLKLELFDNVKKEDIKLIEEDEFLEDVELKGYMLECGYMSRIEFDFSINGIKYNVVKTYNTSSPYALYLCELEDINY